MRRWLSVGLLCWASGCGSEPSDGTSPAGAWRFDAAWEGAGATCSITAATLTLQGTLVQWAGTLSGGEASCQGLPGEAPVMANPPNAVLDSIRVRRDSIAFVLAGENTSLRGIIGPGHMNGVMDVFAPLCDECTGPLLVGTWTAVRP
jgi:hypothetical protein